MQVVENTCIGHEISLRKISEPLALKALDFIPVTAQPQEMQWCRRPHISQAWMWHLHSKWNSGTFSFEPSHLRGGFHTACPGSRGTQLHAGAPGSFRSLSDLRQNPPIHTQTPEVIFKTHTSK